MQQIDPRLLALLQQRMQPQEETSPYYAYGSEMKVELLVREGVIVD